MEGLGSRKRSAAATTVTGWLVRLRWGAVLAQAVTLLVAIFALKLDLQVAPLALLVGLGAVSNTALALRRRRPTEIATTTVGLVLALDVSVLFGLLYFSGGPSNPFSVMYLVQITLAALVLGMRWAMAMVALSAASFAALFFRYVPVSGMDEHDGPRPHAPSRRGDLLLASSGHVDCFHPSRRR